MTMECLICCDHPAYMTIGPCNHISICVECAFKHRSDNKNHKCIYCNTLCKEILAIPNPKPSSKIEFNNYQHKKKTAFVHGIFYMDEGGKLECNALKKISCPIANCNSTKDLFLDTLNLKKHLKKAHRRHFCDLCLDNRKLLLSEQKIYRKQELDRHLQEGDLDNEGNCISLHPFCSFCNFHLYNEQNFLDHNRRDHIKCHICTGKKYKYIFYRDYASLNIHFNKTHFACREKECINKAFIAFRSEAELINHYEHEHTSSKSKGKNKNKGKIISKIGEVCEIIIRDKEAQDIRSQLLSQMKMNFTNQSSQSWKKPMDIIDMFELLFSIRIYEEKILTENGEQGHELFRNVPNFWFYIEHLQKRVSNIKKGKKVNRTEEVRDYIRDFKMEKSRLEKLNKNNWRNGK